MSRHSFLLFYAAVMRSEAARRRHQPEFSAWLIGCADNAEAEARQLPVQLDLFGGK